MIRAAFRRMQGSRYARSGTIYYDLIFALLCSLAFSRGLATTIGLTWPHNVDLYRDIGQAQTVQYGNWLADPLYLGETVWYNPLVPVVVSVVSRITAIPVHIAYTRAGAYLNLLAPITFYILVGYVINRKTALASAAAFLFVVSGNDPSYAAATYSPWLFSANFVQALFYTTLVMYVIALRADRMGWYIATGILLGITFLGHTAPALILGSILLFDTFIRQIHSVRSNARRSLRFRPLLAFVVVMVSALIVSTPFLLSIIGHYHLKILNQVPSNWVYGPLQLSNFQSFATDNLSRPLLMAVISVGLISLIMQQRKRSELRLFLLWLFSVVGFIGYSYFVQIMQQANVSFPDIVPGFHFLFYLRALESILFGLGLVAISDLAARAIQYLLSMSRYEISAVSRQRIEPLMLGGLLLLAFARAYPFYVQRDDFVLARAGAAVMSRGMDDMGLVNWIQAHTQPSDVFLASDVFGLYVAGSAGRKTVAAGLAFSNPYVDATARRRDRDEMFKALAARDETTFRALAAKYNVAYVLAEVGNPYFDITQPPPSFLNVAFPGGQASVYRVSSLPPQP